ncbi:Carbohydrate kinase, partial [Paenimyroides aquimaris]
QLILPYLKDCPFSSDTFICDNSGKVFVNSSGNPSMAQAGMGDVLTGCVASFLSQGYTSLNAAILGCYIHGKSGNELNKVYEITPASMVATQISKTLKNLTNQKTFI